jgi:hypothetical protein
MLSDACGCHPQPPCGGLLESPYCDPSPVVMTEDGCHPPFSVTKPEDGYCDPYSFPTKEGRCCDPYPGAMKSLKGWCMGAPTSEYGAYEDGVVEGGGASL